MSVYYNHVYMMDEFNMLTSDMNEKQLLMAIYEGEKNNLFNPADDFFVLCEEFDGNMNQYIWAHDGKSEPYDEKLVSPEHFISFTKHDSDIWSRCYVWDDDKAYDARNEAREAWRASGRAMPTYEKAE